MLAPPPNATVSRRCTVSVCQQGNAIISSNSRPCCCCCRCLLLCLLLTAVVCSLAPGVRPHCRPLGPCLDWHAAAAQPAHNTAHSTPYAMTWRDTHAQRAPQHTHPPRHKMIRRHTTRWLVDHNRLYAAAAVVRVLPTSPCIHLFLHPPCPLRPQSCLTISKALSASCSVRERTAPAGGPLRGAGTPPLLVLLLLPGLGPPGPLLPLRPPAPPLLPPDGAEGM